MDGMVREGSWAMKARLSLTLFVVAAACSSSTPATPTTPVPHAALAAVASTLPAPAAAGGRVIAQLDDTIGEGRSRPGDRFTATVIAPGAGALPVLPVGTQLVGRVVKLVAAVPGSQGFVRLVVDGILQGNDVVPLDARIVTVELMTPTPTPPVAAAPGARGHEVVGSIIPEHDLPPDPTLERDLLGRGTTISLGSGNALHQLDKGERISVDLGAPAAAEREPVAGREEITDINALADRQPSLIGRRVELAEAPVQGVINAGVFWIGTGRGWRVLVVVDKVLTTAEPKVRLSQVDRVAVSGYVARTPPEAQAPRLWQLFSPAESKEQTDYPLYIFATTVQVKSMR
jgi:hypothetical protein